MDWDDFYDGQFEWSISTINSRISKLQNIGSGDEVADAILNIAFNDEKVATKLLNKAVSLGCKFSADNFCDICNNCDEESYNKAIYSSAKIFNKIDLESLYGYVDDEVLENISKEYGINLPQELSDSANDCDTAIGNEKIIVLVDLIDNAIDSLRLAQDNLNTGSLLNIVDMAGGKFLSSLFKYASVEESQNYLQDAQETMVILNEEFQSFHNSSQLSIEFKPIEQLIDIWLDSDLSNFIFHYKANKLHKKINEAIQHLLLLRRKIIEIKI